MIELTHIRKQVTYQFIKTDRFIDEGNNIDLTKHLFKNMATKKIGYVDTDQAKGNFIYEGNFSELVKTDSYYLELFNALKILVKNN